MISILGWSGKKHKLAKIPARRHAHDRPDPIFRKILLAGKIPSEELLPLVYDELRHLAARRMTAYGPAATLQPTALVHEAWLRLSEVHDRFWNDKAHFFRTAAQAMRGILVDRARRKTALKRNDRLSIPQRLELFIRVCHAIQHAHQKGVIQRHLCDEPVAAHPPTPAYLFGKLIRRNRLAFAVGGIVFLSLTAGLTTSTWLYFREAEARREQVRLRDEAVAARNVESRLRAYAEARETCAQAAVKLSYGGIEQADQLLATIPTELAPSSLEAANTYRAVGDWHRKAGRMRQAAERYTALAASISAADSSDLNKISSDLLPAAAATCEVGDWKRYEQVRRVALERFGNTQNPVVAEQILKVCTLRPADPGKDRRARCVSRRLRPL